MNQFPRKLCFVLLSAAVVVTGCTKKPRPIPADTTAMGAGTGAVNPENMGNLTDASAAGLQSRPPGYEETEDTIRGLLQPVYFDFDRSAIKAAERSKIN